MQLPAAVTGLGLDMTIIPSPPLEVPLPPLGAELPLTGVMEGEAAWQCCCPSNTSKPTAAGQALESQCQLRQLSRLSQAGTVCCGRRVVCLGRLYPRRH